MNKTSQISSDVNMDDASHGTNVSLRWKKNEKEGRHGELAYVLLKKVRTSTGK